MDAEKLIEAIEGAGYEARRYSGRGMFGRHCVGVEVHRNVGEFTMALEIVRAAMDCAETEDKTFAAVDELARLRTSHDALGLNTILYFPGVPWPED
jgi:hypothetical protein